MSGRRGEHVVVRQFSCGVVKADHDAAAALNAALATATRQLHDQARKAETNLDCFISLGSATLTTTADGVSRAVVTAIASYEYT